MDHFAPERQSPVKRARRSCLPLVSCGVAAALLLFGSHTAQAQAAGGATPIATEQIRPAVTEVSQAISAVNVSRWKAPGDVKSSTQGDLDSIRRDLDETLPGLLNAATASPTSLAPAFAVFRNIDALYDVLLRVAETATLAGSKDDSSRLEGALSTLQTARKNFGDSILQAATARDTEVVQLRTAVAQAAKPAETGTPAKSTVVEDGPTAKPAAKRPARKKAAPKPPPATPPQ